MAVVVNRTLLMNKDYGISWQRALFVCLTHSLSLSGRWVCLGVLRARRAILSRKGVLKVFDYTFTEHMKKLTAME